MSDSLKAKVLLVLHAHLPYIRIPDKRFPLQELWLHQAVTESYIPLILCLRELIEEKTDFNITLSISPTLLAMLSDDYFKQKYGDYLATLLEILRKKSINSENGLKQRFEWLLNKIQIISNFYIKTKGNIPGELKKLRQSGKIKLITTTATHALLPLFRFSSNLIRNQIKTGQQAFENEFGFIPEGFWLPEMGYYSNLDAILSSFNVKYTFLDAHSIYLGPRSPSYGSFLPSVTESGIKIFPRDVQLSNIIWSAKTGYPGDSRYREFHFDYTYSLTDFELHDFNIDKLPLGLKIYRITGNDKPKELYNHDEAMEAVNIHSDDFISKIRERAIAVKQHINKIPVFTLPFDAELFGHWWYEGPEFLKQVIKKISLAEDIELISPNDIENKNLEIAVPAESSWGREGYFNTWTNPECSWIYPELAHLDVRLDNIKSDDDKSPASIQAMKELLLASSSDWTFFMSNNTSHDYGKFRLNDHLNTAKKIIDEIESGNTDNSFLKERHTLYPLFENMNNKTPSPSGKK